MNNQKWFIGGGIFFLLISSAYAASSIKEEAIRYRIRGYQLQHQGYPDEAAELYRQAIAEDPNYAAPHNDLGVLWEEKGKLEEAEKEYEAALRIDPNYLDSYSNLSILYEKMQKRDLMITALQKRVTLGKPDDIGTEEARAKLESLGVITDSLQSPPVPIPSPRPRPEVAARTQEAVREEVADAASLRDQGLKRQKMGELDEAIRYYRAAILADPEFATAYNDLGIVLEEKEFLNSAETQYLHALSIRPNYPHALYNLAFLSLKLAKPKEAIRYLERFVQSESVEKGWLEEARRELSTLQHEENEKEEVRRREETSRIRASEEARQKESEEIASRQRWIEDAKKESENEKKLASLLEQGKEAYQKKEVAEAKRLFEEMLLIDPKNASAKSYLAKTRRSVEAAESEKRKIEEAHRREETKKIRVAEEVHRKEKVRLVQETKERTSKEAREKALAERKRSEGEKKKEEMLALYEEAKKRYREGELKKSLAQFEKVIALIPDHPYAGRYIERIREKQKETEETRAARQAEEKAHNLSARKAEEEKRKRIATERASKRFREEKRLAKTKKLEGLRKAIDGKTRKLAETYYEEGLRDFRKGEIDKAIFAYEKVLSLNPRHEKAKRQLVLVREKQTEEEAKQWRSKQEKTYRKEFTDVEERRLYDRAKAAYEAGDYLLAKRTLEYLLTLSPSHPFAQGDLEVVVELMRETRHKEALAKATLKKVAGKMKEEVPRRVEEETFVRAQQGPEETGKKSRPKMLPDLDRMAPKGRQRIMAMEEMALVYQQKAFDLQHQDKIDEAVSYYQKSMAIRSSAGAANGLGVLYERKGLVVQAEDAYRQALALDPAYLPAHTNLALLYERLDRSEESTKHWKIRAEKGEADDFWTQKAYSRLQEVPAEKNP